MKNKFIIAIIVLLALFSTVSINFATVVDDKNFSKNQQTGDEKFDKIFREGRDLIDQEEWAKAAAKFNEIVCDCPEKKGVDAAFYWLAFSYKKLRNFEQMSNALNRLQKNFPNSSWADDARVMRLQQPSPAIITSPQADTFYNFSIAQALTGSVSIKPLEREEEIKLAAFRSLLSVDANRAVALMADILKADSKASENFKIQIIRTLPFSRFSGFGISGLYGFYAATSPAEAAANTVFPTRTTATLSMPTSDNANSITRIIPQIREILMKNYESNSSINLRKEILSALARISDSNSVNYFSQLYNSESNKELKKAILQAFGDTPFLNVSPQTNAAEIRKAMLEKLLEIIKSEKDAELKRFALSRMSSLVAFSKSEQIILSLSQLYDSLTDEDFKQSLIQALANSRQNQAVTKLMSIAKNDNSDKLRLEAIRALQGVNTPEVIKFLEDLIK